MSTPTFANTYSPSFTPKDSFVALTDFTNPQKLGDPYNGLSYSGTIGLTLTSPEDENKTYSGSIAVYFNITTDGINDGTGYGSNLTSVKYTNKKDPTDTLTLNCALSFTFIAAPFSVPGSSSQEFKKLNPQVSVAIDILPGGVQVFNFQGFDWVA